MLRTVLLLAISTSACTSATDPGCRSLCAAEMAGPYDVAECSADSVSACLGSCEARIADTDGLCRACLLEGSEFGTGGDPILLPGCRTDPSCASGARCSYAGVCSYCDGDTAAAASCFRETHPIVEQTCEPYFRPVIECAAFCSP